MIHVKILLNNVQKVKRFSSIINLENAECELIEGAHILNARSIIKIFSLNLNNPILLNIHSEDKEILNRLDEFIVHEC